MTVLSIAVKGCRPSLFPSVGFTILKRSKRNRPGSALIDEDAFAAFLAPLNQSEWVVYGLPSCVRAERTARQTLALMTDAPRLATVNGTWAEASRGVPVTP